MSGEEPTESDLRDAVNHAADAVAFVVYIESDTQLQGVYDEYSVVDRIDESRIVGDIDRRCSRTLSPSSNMTGIVTYELHSGLLTRG